MRNQEGIALMIVFWILTILMVIVLSFSYMARTETYSTLSFKGGADKKFLAEAGVQRGIMELFYWEVYRNQTVELEGKEVWKTDGTPHTGQLGNGNYTVRITDESGKVDINYASELILKNLVMNMGVEEEQAAIVVDSIMDWKDPDDLVRLHGAESDYYMSLPVPYKAKNDNFDTLEELILVKGVTQEILYGTKDKKGLIDFLTVNSKKNRININAAPKEVLMAIPGITPEIADSIIQLRQTKDISLADLGITGAASAVMQQYIDTSGTNTFTIDSFGYNENEKGTYAIRTKVTIYGPDAYKIVYYKSPTEIKNNERDSSLQ